MTWLKLDDGLLDHKKVKRAIRDGGLGALGLHVAGLLNAAKYLTDGYVEEEFVEEIFDMARVRSDDARSRLVSVLVKRELWVPNVERGGFDIHDYLDHNPSREQVEANREWDKRRQQLSRDPELVAAIKKRDRQRCRYCGVRVDWKDRRSSAGATYDHVDPNGPNTLENVVVACRGCNSRKGGRTPEEAQMTLLAPPPASRPRSSDEPEPDGDRPTPRPVPAHARPSSSPLPPSGAGDVPIPPVGNRQADRRRYRAEVEAFAAHLALSGSVDDQVKACDQAIRAGARDESAVRDFIGQWWPQLSDRREAA